jgi:hypothetical protein
MGDELDIRCQQVRSEFALGGGDKYRRAEVKRESGSTDMFSNKKKSKNYLPSEN